ncbi:B12-binding domain-containing radical SAM protein [Leptospira perolatii]|uniref:B12-binding domain-containing radical SAM protein n=1 Tax=Leptospira perolatii TaxID=2023191 RepID=A0A2M9ZSG8_9LEPT|nr:radical SAM protein [Leptospira perolatii]PJZ71504.1 B12-binding domain-containing radical SAM protein [Leptospira perolatii]PJZ75038.1 B12-binding domain-containing radical SAM protein [Leptospira perolatii]
MPKLKLVQLPVPPPSVFAATGNVPLAAGSLAVSARTHGLEKRGLEIEVMDPTITDLEGDSQLADRIAKEEPEFVGFSLYLWNSERSLHLAREVKKRSPGTKILIGGPEVNPDNPFVLSETGYDIAVSGEAEQTFALLIDTLLKKEDPRLISNLSVRGKDGKMSAFSQEENASFPLTSYASPYLEGFVPVDPFRSTYLETVRGCRSQCTYCFYPKSSNVLRLLDIPETIRLLASLKDQGARELVFLDPTFNHRPGFEEFLDAIIEINSDRQMTMFAELRSEGITERLADKLALAGFNRVEIGMQSINKETLKRVKRYGSPEKVAEAAKMLTDRGVELLLDLIIGLPGDSPEDVLRGIDFFFERGLGEWVQVFPLSVLPGTAMRKDSDREGLVYLSKPPYRVIRTPSFSPEDLTETLFRSEDRLNRRLDESPRPYLVDPIPGMIDVFTFGTRGKSDKNGIEDFSRSGARHVSVWWKGEQLESSRKEFFSRLKLRLNRDPFAVTDLVLYPSEPFALSLITELIDEFSKVPPSYLSRTLAHRGENMLHRIVLVLNAESDFPLEWIEEVREYLPVFKEMNWAEAVRFAEGLGEEFPSARIVSDEFHPDAWKILSETADPESVTFSNRELEKRWCFEVLGYSEK